MTPIERYALNFAKVAYHDNHLDALDDTDWHHVHRIFNHFSAQSHDQLAEYPQWINRPKNLTPRDRRRVDEYQRRGEWPIFLFSLKRIETYLDRLKQAQSGEARGDLSHSPK